MRLTLSGWVEVGSLIASLTCLLLAAWNFPARPNLIALGLALIVIAMLVAGLR